MHLRTRPGCHLGLLQAFEELGMFAVVGDRPGLLDVELAVAADDENDHLVIAEWASPEHYERWLAGPDAPALHARIGPLLAAEPETRLYRVVEAVS